MIVSYPAGFWSRFGMRLSRLRRKGGEAACVTHRFTMQLRPGACEVVAQPNQGVNVCCKRGRLWITHDGDPKDIVLDAEQSYTPERCDRMTLQAMQGSEVEMQFRMP